MQLDSIEYYNKNSQAFYDRTVHVSQEKAYQKFLEYLPQKGRILDAGCGVGRDAKFFLSQGYDVEAFDGSIEMVKMASNLLGKQVLHVLFQYMDFLNEFNAVWAHASLLHIPYENLRKIMQRFHQALLPSGVFYATFKYGTSMWQTEDRVFFDMDEVKIEPYLKGLFRPLEVWKSADTRLRDQFWLNCIAKRMD